MRDRLNEDPLAAIVALLRPRTVLSKFVSGAGQWAVQYPDFGHPSFGLMTAGRCWLQVADEAPFEMCAGDYVLLPATPGFRMGSDLAALERPIVRVADPRETRELRHGTPAQDPAARMLGVYFLFDPTSAPLLVGLLPTVVHIRAATSGSARLAWIARAIGEGATEGLPGGGAVAARGAGGRGGGGAAWWGGVGGVGGGGGGPPAGRAGRPGRRAAGGGAAPCARGRGPAL